MTVIDMKLIDQVVNRKGHGRGGNKQGGHEQGADQRLQLKIHARNHVGRHGDNNNAEDNGKPGYFKAVKKVPHDMHIPEHAHVSVEADLARKSEAWLRHGVCF